jgi:hypothetical protein
MKLMAIIGTMALSIGAMAYGPQGGAAAGAKDKAAADMNKGAAMATAEGEKAAATTEEMAKKGMKKMDKKMKAAVAPAAGTPAFFNSDSQMQLADYSKTDKTRFWQRFLFS